MMLGADAYFAFFFSSTSAGNENTPATETIWRFAHLSVVDSIVLVLTLGFLLLQSAHTDTLPFRQP